MDGVRSEERELCGFQARRVPSLEAETTIMKINFRPSGECCSNDRLTRLVIVAKHDVVDPVRMSLHTLAELARLEQVD